MQGGTWRQKKPFNGRVIWITAAKWVTTCVMKCNLCEDVGSICERHPTRPWEGDHACTCGGAGAPCPMCNSMNDADNPRMPSGFKIEADKDGGRH
jgi:hypothetical protein